MNLPWCGSSVAPRAVTSTRSRTTGILGVSTSAAGAARSGHSERSAGNRRSPESLDADLIALVDRLARRLRAAHRVCRTVVLRLRFDDFTRATRSHTIPEATADTATLLAAERALLVAALPMIRDLGITLIGITFTNLQNDGAIQLALPFDGWHGSSIDATLDTVRDRFGSSAITRGVLLGRREGLRVPLLPD